MIIVNSRLWKNGRKKFRSLLNTDLLLAVEKTYLLKTILLILLILLLHIIVLIIHEFWWILFYK